MTTLLLLLLLLLLSAVRGVTTRRLPSEVTAAEVSELNSYVYNC
jgi:putative flippase GtrA